MDERIKDYLDQLDIPENGLEQAIGRAVAQNNREKKSKKIWFTSFIAVAAICVLFLSIRMSPTIAMAMGKVPGLEILVQLIHHNKGIQDSLNAGYSEKIGATVEQQGISITIDEVIADESGMVIAYQINSEQNLNKYEYFHIEVLQNNELIDTDYTYSKSMDKGEVVHQLTNTIDVVATETTMDYTNSNFAVRFTFNDLQMDVPFELKDDIQPGQVYVINEQLEMDGQKFTVEQVKITPLRTSISIAIDPSNSQRILEFGSIVLIDEKGENWGSHRNGILSTNSIDNLQVTYYLQSNYFRTPETLTLHIRDMAALPKGQDYIEVDFEKGEMLFVPTLPNLVGIELLADGVIGKYKPIDYFNTHIILFGQAVDANGNEVKIREIRNSGDLDVSESKVHFELAGHQNPIKIYFNHFPCQLEGAVEVEVPLK